MNRKLIIGSVLAVFMLVAVSYTSAIDTNTVKNAGDFSEQEVEKQQNLSDETKETWSRGFISLQLIDIDGSFTRNGIYFILRNVRITSGDYGFLGGLTINGIDRGDMGQDFNEFRMNLFIGIWYSYPGWQWYPTYIFNGFARGISLT